MIRPARPDDYAAIAAIQRSSPEAAQWDPAGYDVQVAEIDGSIVGFLVTRVLAQGEVEILNLAVAPEFRRRGVAKALVGPLLDAVHGDVFLEVRDSNRGAIKLYELLGFERLIHRPSYYENPQEAGIVMKFHSC